MFDVVIQSASLRFGNHCVFDNLNLTLKGGQWTCLLGGSGVGKTSLLRLIAGLPAGETTGEVVCQDGFPVHHRIAWMAQQDLLLPWFSVLENITLGQRLRRSFTDMVKRHPLIPPEIEEQAMSILEKVGLTEKASVLPQHLSGGQRQRAALARTLMENRPLVLMDEPFGALDAITRLNLQDLACELLENRTVLLITHDPLEALRLGHDVYHLRGSPARLTDAITPPGKTPRSLEDNGLMMLQGKLLDRLRHESFDKKPAVDNKESRQNNLPVSEPPPPVHPEPVEGCEHQAQVSCQASFDSAQDERRSDSKCRNDLRRKPKTGER